MVDLRKVWGQTMQAKGKRRLSIGFTIIELMVVMLIMMLLLVLLAPSIQKIHRTTMRRTALNTIAMLEGACNMYFADFSEYPLSNDDTNENGDTNYAGWTGNQLLVLFLVGYMPDISSDGTPGMIGTDVVLHTDDGEGGLGFRVEKRGKVFGPYNGAENVRTSGSPPVFVDAFDEQIYYYRFDSGSATYYTTDNPTPPGLEGASVYSNYLASVESRQSEYILMTAGPNGVFTPSTDPAVWLQTDDITNFLEEQH